MSIAIRGVFACSSTLKCAELNRRGMLYLDNWSFQSAQGGPRSDIERGVLDRHATGQQRSSHNANAVKINSVADRFYGAARRQIAPRLKYSQTLYQGTLNEHLKPEMKWLDLGCGHQLLPSWCAEDERTLSQRCRLLVGIDYDLPSLQQHKNITLRVRGDITQLPFADNSFDLVTANMVVEHLDNPELQFESIHRVLRPGGVFIFHTPNAHGHATVMARMVPHALKNRMVSYLDGRRQEDVFETHYKANTRKQIDAVARRAGLDVVKLRMLVSEAVFAAVPPLAVIELAWIRLLMTEPLAEWRTTIIAVLRKQGLAVNATHVVHSGVPGNNGGCETNPVFLEEPPNETSS